MDIALVREVWKLVVPSFYGMVVTVVFATACSSADTTRWHWPPCKSHPPALVSLQCFGAFIAEYGGHWAGCRVKMPIPLDARLRASWSCHRGGYCRGGLPAAALVCRCAFRQQRNLRCSHLTEIYMGIVLLGLPLNMIYIWRHSPAGRWGHKPPCGFLGSGRAQPGCELAASVGSRSLSRMGNLRCRRGHCHGNRRHWHHLVPDAEDGPCTAVVYGQTILDRSAPHPSNIGTDLYEKIATPHS